MATLSASRHDLFAVVSCTKEPFRRYTGGEDAQVLSCVYFLLSYLSISMRMQRISVSTPLLFGAYLAAVDELSKLTFKSKIFQYFTDSARKR